MPAPKRHLTKAEIIRWAQAHYRRTGRWPTHQSGAIVGAPGETWEGIRQALKDGRRGFPGGSSVNRLLAEFRRVRPREAFIRREKLTKAQILKWAAAHHGRCGIWPGSRSGRVDGAEGLTWQAVDQALRHGFRGFRGGSSLPALIGRKDGTIRNLMRPRLTVGQILAWADEHRRRHGSWPRASRRYIPGSGGETWQAVQAALSAGIRGLTGGSSLPRLLAKYRGAHLRRRNTTPLTERQILAWADAHRQRTGRWPGQFSGRIADAPNESWSGVQAAMLYGSRGLRVGSTIAKLLVRSRHADLHMYEPRLTEDLIIEWARAHQRRTGALPNRHSGRIVDAPRETWSAVQAALWSGNRGLAGGSSLSRLLSERLGTPFRPHLKTRLTARQILAWADAHFRHTRRWPHKRAGAITGAEPETWLAVNQALQNGYRGCRGGTSLARFLMKHRDIDCYVFRPRLTPDAILLWARAHCRRTGEWPTDGSGRVTDAPRENWHAINVTLALGYRGLEGGSSLARLIAGRRKPTPLEPYGPARRKLAH